MIMCPVGLFWAHFRNGRVTPVMAWDEIGQPLVFDPGRNRLWAAPKLPGFRKIEERRK